MTNSFAAVCPHHSVVTLAKITLAMPLQVARQLSTVAVDHNKVAVPVQTAESCKKFICALAWQDAAQAHMIDVTRERDTVSVTHD